MNSVKPTYVSVVELFYNGGDGSHLPTGICRQRILTAKPQLVEPDICTTFMIT